MGQAVIKPSRGAVVGEVDVGLEALFLLESPEEHSTVILKMVPDTPLASKRMREFKSRRIRRSQSLREVEMEEEYQASEGESQECSNSFTCHEGDKRRDMVEEQLVDVFYSAFHLHVPREAQSHLGASSNSSAHSTTACLATEDLLKELGDIFQVNETTLKLVEEEVKEKKPPRLTLHIIIHEAKDLKPKASKETSHPYCLVRVSGSTETFKTRVINSTLMPSWESQFSTGIPTLRDAKLMVEVWHEPQEAGVKQLIAMRDLREFSHLVRDAAANIQMKETRNLLGTVTVPLSELKDQSLEGWFNLVKSREDEINQVSTKESLKPNKKRGSIRISLKVSTVAELNHIGPHWFDAFLKKVIHHHLGYLSIYSNFRRGSKRWSERSIQSTKSSTRRNKINTSSNTNNKSNIIINSKHYSTSSGTSSNGSSPENEAVWDLLTPWNGLLNSTCQSLLDYYAATLNLTPPVTILSWWKVSSECHITDQAFLLNLLKIVQGYLKEERYSEEEIQEIRSSLKMWTSTQIDRLRNLTTYFPASTKYISCDQLKGMLRNLYALEADPQTRELWPFPKDLCVSEHVSEALTDFTKKWWESSLKNRGRNSPMATEDQQLVAAVSVAGEVFSFLSDVCSFYHDVLLREAKISYLRLTYILLTSELAARVRPLLIKIYKVPAKEKHNEADKRSLEAGTSVWQLYKKLENIEKIGENLPNEVQLQSGIRGYHKWFLGGVVRWQRRLFARTRDHISKEVEGDKFEVDPSYIRSSPSITSFNLIISSSASGSKSNFTIIKGLWQKLAWPYEVEGDKVASQLLQDLCGLGTHYTKLVIAKLDAKFREEDALKSVFLPAEICIGLNNIEYVRLEIESLPELFEFLEEENGRNKFSIVEKTVSKMEGAVLLLMDNIINKIKPVLRTAVVSSCNTGNEARLLQDVLDEGFRVLQQRLDDTNFQRFLLKIWNVLIVIFCDIVESNSTKQNAEYFKKVYNVLDRTWYFFTPTDRRGLEPQQAHTDEYQSLKNTLCNLKMATEFLIAKYYRERFDELKRSHQHIAELYVQVYFTRTGKLIIDVTMAANKIRRTERHPDVFVQIKLVPSDWFRNAVAKTKPQKIEDSTVFNEKFEFLISHADQGVKSGHLLFVMKTHQRFHSDKVICETVIPLDEIDMPTPNNIKPKVLNMNIPRNVDGLESG
nr:protein unc-13 homolog 4B-like isoform X3 [Procambarus clarkii]